MFDDDIARKTFLTFRIWIIAIFIASALVASAAAQLPTNNNPANQIRFSTPAAADAARVRLTNFIWGEGLPTVRMPAVTPNIASNVFSGDLQGIAPSLVSQVTRLDADVSGFDFHALSYLLRPVNSANINRIVIVHQGHDEIDPLGGGLARTANALLQQGFSVDLMQMPMFGWNGDHTAIVPGQGLLDYGWDQFNSHVAMIHMTGPPQGGMGFRLFLEPVIQNINYLETLPGLSDITMIGLSGGGWTTHMAAAIDARIRLSVPVAGSAPLYWRNTVGKIDGAEEEYVPLYNEDIAPDGSGGGVATWLEIYTLGGYGSGRQQIMVTNLFDPCCFSGTYADGFKAIVSHRVTDVLGQGEWGHYLDSTTRAHEIAVNTLYGIIFPALGLPLVITNAAPLPSASFGTAYSQTLMAAGGTPPYSNWTVTSGNLPGGLSMNSTTGTISGTATGSCGTFSFTVRVSDSGGATASANSEIPFTCALTITTPPLLPPGTLTAAYFQALAVANGAPPYSDWTVKAGRLPPGLSLNSTAGILEGTPVGVSGTFNFTVGVRDTVGHSGSQSFQVTIQPPPITTALARVGSFAQVASGGGWKTSMALINLSSVTINAQVNLYGDDGRPRPLPLVFPQFGLSTSTASVSLTLGPNQSLVIESEASSSSTEVGWADIEATAALSGYSIFRFRAPGVPDSEGTVPLDNRLSSSLVVPYDNTNGYATGVALANQGAISASVAVRLLDQNGVQLASTQIDVPALGHTSFYLTERFSQSAGQLGIIQFQNASGGITGVGLRFNPYSSFTSVPIIR